MQDQQVRLILSAEPVNSRGRRAQVGGGPRQGGERLLDGRGLRELTLFIDGGVRGQPRPADHLRSTSACSKVMTMTPEVTKMIRLRSGNGRPEWSAAGTESATASDTAPRNPASPLTTRERLLTRRSRCCGRRSIRRMR